MPWMQAFVPVLIGSAVGSFFGVFIGIVVGAVRPVSLKNNETQST